MADLTITITNSLNVFGPAGTNRWAAWNWGAFKWGEGTKDLTAAVIKVIANTAILTDTYTRAPGRVITNTLTVTGDMTDETLSNNSWTYNFPDRATDAEDRDFATWTADSEESTTWTADSEESTEWDS